MTAAMQMALQTWRGYSAYEIAVQNGFEGTQAQWLESLKGPPGEASDELSVNNKQPVDGNITIRATDIYVRAGLATTVAQKLESCITSDLVVDALDSADGTKVLSAAQGSVLKTGLDARAQTARVTVVLPASGWALDSGTGLYGQTVSVPGVTADEGRTSVIVSPSTDREAELLYTGYGVRASAQGANALTFTALGAPDADVTAHVLVIDMGVTA